VDEIRIVGFDPDHATGVAGLARTEGWPTFSDPDRVVRLFTAPGVVGVVAVRSSEVLGAAHLLTDGHHAYLTTLVVAAGVRGTGIGRRLVVEAFRSTGAERIDLLSTPEAEPFYRSLYVRELPDFRIYPNPNAS